MTPECFGLLGFFALLAMLFLRVPVAVSMGVVGVVGMVSLLGSGAGRNLLGRPRGRAWLRTTTP